MKKRFLFILITAVCVSALAGVSFAAAAPEGSGMAETAPLPEEQDNADDGSAGEAYDTAGPEVIPEENTAAGPEAAPGENDAAEQEVIPEAYDTAGPEAIPEETAAAGTEAASEETDTPEVPEGMAFSIQNAAGADYISLEMRPSLTETWSGDLLPEGTVWQAGDELFTAVPEAFSGNSLGLYDIRLTSSDGNAEEVCFVPLLENTRGILRYTEGVLLISVTDERIRTDAQYVGDAEIRAAQQAQEEALVNALADDVRNF